MNALGIAPVCPVEQVNKSTIALAEKDDLHIAAHEVSQHALDQIQPLLLGEPRNHADERHIPLLQPAFPLQIPLANTLLFQRVRVEMVRQIAVVRRIEYRVIQTVENPAERVFPRAQESVQIFAKERSLDLLGIGGAHGAEPVGKHKPALHAADATEKFEIFIGEVAIFQSQPACDFAPGEDALILEIVDGEHGLDARIVRLCGVLRLEQRRNQPRLPVVEMQHLRHKVDVREAFKHRAAKERKPQSFGYAVAIDLRYAKVRHVVHKVVGNPVVLHAFDTAIERFPAKEHVKRANLLHARFPVGIDHAIVG